MQSSASPLTTTVGPSELSSAHHQPSLQRLLEQFSTTTPHRERISPPRSDPLATSAAAGPLRLEVDASPLQQMFRDVVDVVRHQQTQIDSLQKLLQESEERHHQAITSLWREFDQRLSYTVDHVATAMDAVRRETTNACQRALPDAQAIPAILDRVRRVEEAMESQRQLNAVHHVELVALQSSSLSVVSPQSRSYYASPSVGTFDVSSSGMPPGEVDQLRRDVDDLLALFEIPNVFSARTQRSLTSTSLHRVAALGSDKRVQFIHALPAFHSIWTEMHRLFQQSIHPDGRTPQHASFRPVSPPPQSQATPQPAGRGQRSLNSYASPFVAMDSSDAIHSTGPSSTRWEDFLVDGAGHSGSTQAAALSPKRHNAVNHAVTVTTETTGATVAIASLGADVANHSGATTTSGPARGVVVLRLAHGGPLEVSGATVGDVITQVDNTSVAGSFHLLDIMNEYVRKPHVQTCTVSLIPAGRTHSLPVTVRIAF